MTGLRVLLTGATGFVGSATRQALVARGVRLRLLAHRRPVSAADGDVVNVDVVHADLATPASLEGCCSDVDVVVHLASAIEADEPTCQRINTDGTAALVAEARRAGVKHVVYLSTAAVYGDAGGREHVGITENQVAPQPVSATSATRLAAEQFVRDAGGVVVRPLFVYGPGDRWFVPQLYRTFQTTPVRLNGGRARLSTIDVADLAEVITTLALDGRGGGTYHVAEPQPVTLGEIQDSLVRELGATEATQDVDFDTVAPWLAADERRLRQAALLAFDHFYDSTAVWQRTGITAARFVDRLPEYADWYRTHLE